MDHILNGILVSAAIVACNSVFATQVAEIFRLGASIGLSKFQRECSQFSRETPVG